MCAGCVGSFDAMTINAIGASAAAGYQYRRVRSWFFRVPSTVRRAEAWRRNAEFCIILGLEPVEVLGPDPLPALVEAT